MRYAGLDIHRTFCQATVMAEDGSIVKTGKFPSNREGLREFMADIGEAKVVIEATGVWEHLYDLLEEEGYDVTLSHPLETKAIAHAKVKTDKVDSRILAHLLRADLVPSSYIPPKEVRELRKLVRHRLFLVRLSTKLKNSTYGEIMRRGVEYETGKVFTDEGRQWLSTLGMYRVDANLRLLEAVEEQIGGINEKIKDTAMSSSQARLLTSIPGIGPYSALLILAEIGDIGRFPDSEKLCGYAGLVPSTHQSGSVVKHGPITKEGSRYLRWILVESVHIHVRYCDSYLTRFFHKLERKKGKKVATVATARKMLKAIWWMLTTGQEFNPQGQGRTPWQFPAARPRRDDWRKPLTKGRSGPQCGRTANRWMSHSRR